MLPESYTKRDVITSVQNVALLTAAFALGRDDLMPLATRDCLHQPYRAELCPLLPALRPLAGSHGVMSVTLSGAGPAVMLLTRQPGEANIWEETVRQAILQTAGPMCAVEILAANVCAGGAVVSVGE